MFIIDFHVDTLMRLYDLKSKGNNEENLWCNKGHIDFERLMNSHYSAQFFASFLNLAGKPINGSHYEDALAMIDMFKEQIKQHPDKVAYAGSYKEYSDNKNAGKLSGILTVEEGGIVEGKMERLDVLYQKGIRVITLTWNYENCFGYPNHKWQYQNNGLKPFGIEALAKMDELGIIIDVSHLSDGGFWDVCKYAKRPFMATHSNARAVENHNRNLSDEMIKKLADKGGITGLNFGGPFLQADGRSTVDAMLKHLRHLINVGGTEIAGLGTDFDGVDGDMELTGAQDMPKLIEAMEHAKFTSKEIESICYKNAEEFMKRYWGNN